jgi:phosphomannomutase
MTHDLAEIFKAYDVRGVVPGQWNETVAYAIGRAFAELCRADGGPQVPAILVGHDMRVSSPSLTAALIDGIVAHGVDVDRLGLVATDELYFASGSSGLPGVVVTASHNPGDYNGLKFCRGGAVPVGRDSGLDRIRAIAESMVTEADAAKAGIAPVRRRGPGRTGTVRDRDVLEDYVAYLHLLVPVTGRRLTVVVDAANGMAGHTVPAVFAGLDVELHGLYLELDGTFPHHEANPLDSTTLTTLQGTVRATGADVGLAFDGDADRCFVVDEGGNLVSPSAILSLIAARELDRAPGSVVIHNLITSRAVPETIRAHGGVPVRTPVGHSIIKQTMAAHDAVLGGEHSGHFYFRDFWYADSGMLAALHVLAALAASERPLSDLAASLVRYAASGEINVTTADSEAAIERVRAAFGGDPDVEFDELDGVTIEHPDWWLNVRPSNTEPLLRLNVEAVDTAMIEYIRDRAVTAMRRSQ